MRQSMKVPDLGSGRMMWVPTDVTLDLIEVTSEGHLHLDATIEGPQGIEMRMCFPATEARMLLRCLRQHFGDQL